MSGFLLDDQEFARVHAELPNIEDIQLTILSLHPDLISSKYPPESEIPVASVCLNDTNNALVEARYALHEYFAYRIHCLEKVIPSDSTSFAFYGRFYLDDVAIRLYSAGEHLANATIYMLEINSDQLHNYEASRVSIQSIVGNFLVHEMNSHPITQILIPFAKSAEWSNTMKYRNRLVHEQPPTIAGSGAIYKRQNRWRFSEDIKSYMLGLGTIDEAEYSLDQILAFIQPSIHLFADVLKSITNYYISLISEKGIKIIPGKGIQVSF